MMEELDQPNIVGTAPMLMVYEPTSMGNNDNNSNATSLSLINKHKEFLSFLATSNVVTEVMLLGGMRRSDIKPKTCSNGFDEDTTIKYFGILEIEYMGDVIPIPRRGRFRCKGCKGGRKGQCIFNVSFTFDMRFKKEFLLLDTEKTVLH